MKILVLSDAHGNVEALRRIKEVATDVDLILFGGDFSDDTYTPESGKPLIDLVTSMNDNVFAVLGNCDDPFLQDDLEAKDIAAEGMLSRFDGLLIAGSGGGTVFTGTTPNERDEDDLVNDFSVLEAAYDSTESAGWNNLVLIMHNPPADTVADKISNGVHVGSKKLRALIDTYKPLLVVCGHIHESAGTEVIGATTIVNPGAVLDGRYAMITLSGGESSPFNIEKVELCSL